MGVVTYYIKHRQTKASRCSESCQKVFFGSIFASYVKESKWLWLWARHFLPSTVQTVMKCSQSGGGFKGKEIKGVCCTGAQYMMKVYLTFLTLFECKNIESEPEMSRMGPPLRLLWVFSVSSHHIIMFSTLQLTESQSWKKCDSPHPRTQNLSI